MNGRNARKSTGNVQAHIHIQSEEELALLTRRRSVAQVVKGAELDAVLREKLEVLGYGV
jgi:hypothetical protein